MIKVEVISSDNPAYKSGMRFKITTNGSVNYYTYNAAVELKKK